MRKLTAIICVVAVSLLFLTLTGCKAVYSDKDIKAEMENLTPEELNAIINEANQSDSLIGKAYAFFYNQHDNTKLYKVDPKKRILLAKEVLENNKDGCYLKINEDKIWLTSSKSECKSLFIAESFVGRQDLYKLFKSLGYSYINPDQILNMNNSLEIYYQDQGSSDYFSEIEGQFSSNLCEELSFFGVKTFCFNQIPAEKKSNFEYIIKYLTVLKYTSNLKHENLLTNEVTNAYYFIINNEIVYYDASHPESYGEMIETVRCEPTQGDANFQKVSGENRVYLCKTMMSSSSVNGPTRLFSASIIYHEAVHKYQLGHDYDVNCTKTNGGNTGDKDFKSVYGAHINLLFSMSQNDILNCEERMFVFNEAEKLMGTKLCQIPNKPNHGYPIPCS